MNPCKRLYCYILASTLYFGSGVLKVEAHYHFSLAQNISHETIAF